MSFIIEAESVYGEKLLDPGTWGEGILVKRYWLHKNAGTEK